ncbi:MAG: SAM hydroxide adenosyltransferase [Candidatus Bathyarchaeia archaeon]
MVGEVIHVDDFGNIVTNFGEKELSSVSAKGYVDIKLGNTQLKLKLCKAYAEAEPQEPLAIIGSHDFLEISLNQGNAAKNLRVKSGDKIILCRS